MNPLGNVLWKSAVLCALVTSAVGAQGVPGGKYAIQTFRGNYLTAVNGGGVAGRNAINTDATRIAGWETFTLVPQTDGTHAIQTATGNYVTALNGGGIAGKVALHTDARAASGWEKFGLIKNADGTYSIRTANGRYWTAVNGGGIGGGNIAIHTDATQINGWEKFKLISMNPVSCVALPERWWYLTGSTLAIWTYPDGRWTSREITHGDPTRTAYWGSYRCVGTNTWAFVNGYNATVRTLALVNGTLVNTANGEVWK